MEILEVMQELRGPVELPDARKRKW